MVYQAIYDYFIPFKIILAFAFHKWDISYNSFDVSYVFAVLFQASMMNICWWKIIVQSLCTLEKQ